MSFPKVNFSGMNKPSQLTKEQCLQILGESIELNELNTLAASAKKNGPESFAKKIKTLLGNPLVKMQM